MQPLKKILVAALCCFLMAGCASSGEEQDISVYNDPGVAMTFPEMAREMSDGSVQIYSLDGPAPSIMEAPPPTAGAAMLREGGVPYAGDPNVTVYPFEDSTAWPAQSGPPDLQPPSSQYRALESPFGGPLQSPAPLPQPEFDGPMERSDAQKIYFRHGSTRLDEAAREIIEYVRNMGGNIVVEGHASSRTETSDPVESSIVNLKMSMDRAFRVSSALIRSGVPARMIRTRAYGDMRPAAPDSQEDLNRRVEIYTGGGSPSATGMTGDSSIPSLSRY